MLLWKPIPTVFGIMSGSGMKLCLGYRDDIYVAVAFICKCRLSCFFCCIVKGESFVEQVLYFGTRIPEFRWSMDLLFYFTNMTEQPLLAKDNEDDEINI